MSTSPFLDLEELVKLTQRKRSGAQAKVLKHLGIEHRLRPDNTIVVLSSHLEQVFGDASITRTKKQPEPSWGAL